jgi:hypothetical protein
MSLVEINLNKNYNLNGSSHNYSQNLKEFLIKNYNGGGTKKIINPIKLITSDSYNKFKTVCSPNKNIRFNSPNATPSNISNNCGDKFIKVNSFITNPKDVKNLLENTKMKKILCNSLISNGKLKENIKINKDLMIKINYKCFDSAQKIKISNDFKNIIRTDSDFKKNSDPKTLLFNRYNNHIFKDITTKDQLNLILRKNKLSEPAIKFSNKKIKKELDLDHRKSYLNRLSMFENCLNKTRNFSPLANLNKNFSPHTTTNANDFKTFKNILSPKGEENDDSCNSTKKYLNNYKKEMNNYKKKNQIMLTDLSKVRNENDNLILSKGKLASPSYFKVNLNLVKSFNNCN